MAEYPTTDINSQLIGAGLNTDRPTNTYTDFASQLAKNSQDQAMQEQAIARAVELTKQAQLQTRQGAQAEKAGINSLMGDYMTPNQAAQTIKIYLNEKGLPVDEDMINKWIASFNGQPINRQVVESFANRLFGERTHAGQTSKFTTDMPIPIPEGKVAKDLGLTADKDDLTIGHVPSDGMYQVLYDNQGKVMQLIPGGKEPADQSLKTSQKEDQFWQREWDKIAKSANPYSSSSRNSVGVAMQSYVRAVRALEALQADKVTKQKAAQVIAEIDAIYKGGSPDQTTLEMTLYPTMYGKLHDWMQSIRGRAENYVPDDIKKYLVDQITELNNRSKQVVEGFIESTETLNQQTIDHFPDQWDKFKKQFVQQLEHPEKDVMPGIEKGPAVEPSSPIQTGTKPPLSSFNK